MTTDRQREALEAFQRTGSIRAAARELGIQPANVRRALDAIDPGIRAAMQAAGTGLVPSAAWVKTKATDDAPGYSVLLRPEPGPDMLERIADAFADLPAAMPIPAPEEATGRDLCTVYPIFDAHLGMLAWGRESGEDYDLSTADVQLRNAVARLVARSPASELAVVLIGGDFFHVDDTRNETPQHRHKLDADSRFAKLVDTGVETVAACIEAAAARADRVHVRVLRGNHDEHSHHVLRVGLGQRYRSDPRVTVLSDPSDFYTLEWGRCFVAAHHGDKGKPERLALFMASEWPEAWGRTRHRYFWTGHIHHERARDIGGVQWESFRPAAPRDAYAASHGYAASRTIQAITLCRHAGEAGRQKIHLGRAA